MATLQCAFPFSEVACLACMMHVMRPRRLSSAESPELDYLRHGAKMKALRTTLPIYITISPSDYPKKAYVANDEAVFKASCMKLSHA